ncbi:hypothetical protein PMAYCL1PPCAC_02078, partial [Pristionchus mayeri]
FQSGELSLPTILRKVINSLLAPRMGKVEEEELIGLSNVDKEKGQLNGWSSSRVAPCARHRPRLLAKHGRTLLGIEGLPHKWRNDVRNWFHLLIECSWSFVLFLFSIGYLGTWIFYGIIYFFIYLNYPTNTEGESVCITQVRDFSSAFLFSMESQHTIGYGTRHMTTECPLAYFVLMTQCIFGVFVQTMLGGVIIAKVLRPKKRKQEMRFSEVAVIGPVDEKDRRPALFIRIADIQEKLFLAESHVRLYIAQHEKAKNGSKVLVGLKDMNVGYDSGWDRVLLLWPVMVRHVIDEHSPLYGLTEDEMREKDFELIMTVEGIVEATGMTFQARTSFLPEEIVWNHKFVPIVILNEKKKKYEIQYDLFDATEKVVDWEWNPNEENEDESHEYKSGFI